MSGVYIYIYNREEELTRNKRGKERTINLKRKKKITYPFFSLSSSSCSVYSRNDCMLSKSQIEPVKVIL
jgi:hypothetical protein